MIQTVIDSCLEDTNCEVNFLRAFCEKFDVPECQSETFESALEKENGCLPGKWGCTGFQEMFEGPTDSLECSPWDLPCALQDKYGVNIS